MTVTLVEETRYRLDCCVDGTNEGWGEPGSLRNHLMCVNSRVDELQGLYDEIEALPADNELRADGIIVELMQEYRELVDARADAEMYLGIEPVSPVERAEPLTPVVLRVGKEGEVFALFPTLPSSGYYCESYEHVGQHSGADYHGCIQESRPATVEESKALVRELEGRGYRLRVVKRASPTMHNARMRA